MQSFVVWVRATGLSTWVRTDPWTWPALEITHFIGICLLLGVIGVLDARLLGGLRGVEVKALRRLMPWGLGGFILSFISGVLFFVGAPDQYVGNPAFYMKLLFLGVAGLNAAYFETRSGTLAVTMGTAMPPPRAFKIAGAVSLVSWAMVMYWGRMLPFIGNAF